MRLPRKEVVAGTGTLPELRDAAGHLMREVLGEEMVDEVVELAIWRLFLNIGLDICSILILRLKPPLILAVLITKSAYFERELLSKFRVSSEF